jgi:hypothetical protein
MINLATMAESFAARHVGAPALIDPLARSAAP